MKKLIEEKEIKYLVHFTQLNNLENILKYGLMPRKTIDEEGINYSYNDEWRYDGCLNANCCSISFPNYKMFYSIRMENKGVEWIVLAIKPRILYKKDVAFTPCNAASDEITKNDIEIYKGKEAFNKLFEDFHDVKRNNLNIDVQYPTNPQSEVLIFDIIEPKNIFAIVVNNEKTKEKLIEKYPKMQIKYIPRFFDARSDYSHWSK